MSFWILLLIMALSGCIGGIVNYLLPANNPEPKKFLNPIHSCILLGLGATLLVPLFLEIAQSKLLDDIHFEWKLKAPEKQAIESSKDTIKIVSFRDTSTLKIKADTTIVKSKNTTPKTAAKESSNEGKSYLIWAAYCLLAGAAGFRFINMLIKNVVKEEEVNTLKNEKKQLLTEKKLEGQRDKIDALKEEQKVVSQMRGNNITAHVVMAAIGPVTVPEDPQKNRFGGLPFRNNRTLKAKVKESAIPNFYDVQIWVESTDPEHNPLKSDCVFYIHDSFRPSVYTVSPTDNIAKSEDILSYGAFTVGVVTDNGNTLLELDLSEDKEFPKQFRES